MNKITKFEDIIAWQKAQDFAIIIYEKFEKTTDFGFSNQILRASISISNNIAEGYERNSNLDFRRFLFISLGSCSEVRSMLYLAKKLKKIDENEFEILHSQSIEISKLIKGFINSIKVNK